jgi:hypothetical protein
MTEKALAVLEDDLDNGPGNYQTKAAIAVLRLAGLPGIGSCIGEQDAAAIVRRQVEAERKAARNPLDDVLEGHGLPPFDDHMARKWDDLEALAACDTAEGASG